MNYNSTTNQRIKGQFVDREIMACASQMIYELQQKSEELNTEIMELFYSLPDFDQAIEDWECSATKDEINEVLEFFGVESIEDIEQYELIDHLNLDVDYLDPLEFWIVTNYLAEKLKNNGQIVEEFLGFNIWGRLTSGQAILLDHCISVICDEMEILEGQDYEWK